MKNFIFKLLTIVLFLSFIVSAFAEGNFSRKYKGIRIPLGKTFTIDLDSNPSTGFSWQLANISDKTVLEIVKKEYVGQGSLTVGSPGTERWIFKSVGIGKTALTFEYKRSWEDKEEAQRTEVYSIIVK